MQRGMSAGAILSVLCRGGHHSIKDVLQSVLVSSRFT